MRHVLLVARHLLFGVDHGFFGNAGWNPRTSITPCSSAVNLLGASRMHLTISHFFNISTIKAISPRGQTLGLARLFGAITGVCPRLSTLTN